MFDHVSIGVADVSRAKRFYDAVLQPLGYRCLSEGADSLGYGGQSVALWVNKASRPVSPDQNSGLHFCFAAPTRKGVDAFHKAALASGGRDNGAPGIRPHYHPTYYGAFVLDPDGNNIEAVCHQPDDTHHLMSSPSNARRPSDAVRQLEAGRDRDEVERSEMQD